MYFYMGVENKNLYTLFSLQTHAPIHCQTVRFQYNIGLQMRKLFFLHFNKCVRGGESINTCARARINLWNEHWHMILIRYGKQIHIAKQHTMCHTYLLRVKEKKIISYSIFIISAIVWALTLLLCGMDVRVYANVWELLNAVTHRLKEDSIHTRGQKKISLETRTIIRQAINSKCNCW